MSPATALLSASCLHAGFSVTVTAVVYPALAATPRERWPAAHAAHSRRISYVVGPLYLLVAAACAWALASGPSPGQVVAVVGNAVAALVTAVAAAPTHAALGRYGPGLPLLRRLLKADRLRTAAAVLAAVAALLAA